MAEPAVIGVLKFGVGRACLRRRLQLRRLIVRLRLRKSLLRIFLRRRAASRD